MPARTSKKFVAPSLEDPNLQIIVTQIYDALNELADAVNKVGDETTARTTGQPGDTRITVDRSNHKIVLQGRTKDGWANIVSVDSNKAFEK